MSRDLLDTISAIVEHAQEVSARIAQRQAEIHRFTAERDQNAGLKRFIHHGHIRDGVEGSSRAEREASLELRLSSDEGYCMFADREEGPIVALEELQVELDRDLGSFSLDLVGRCRARRSSLFWDEPGIGTLCPTPGMAPNDSSPFQFGQAGLASRTWTIAQAVESFSIEPDDLLWDGLGMIAELLGDDGRALPLPAPHDHPGSDDPVARRMATSGELPDLLLFLGIKG
jgi:hypothetical protein